MDDTLPRITSLRYAALVVCCQNDPKYAKLLSDPTDPCSRWCATTHSFAGRLAIFASSIPILSGIIFESWRKKVPGGLLHFLARKRFVEDQIRESIENGFKQIVIFGSGYDSLGVRLAREFPHIHVFEVDHPPTQAVKLLALEKHSARPRNLHLIPVQLRKGTLERHLLQEHGYDTHLHVLFVAERVLPYLPDGEVDEMFNFVYEHGVVNSRFIFSVVDKILLNDKSSFLYREAEKSEKQGRPIRSSINLDEIEKFLFQRGLKGLGFANDKFLTEQYLTPAGYESPPILGELVVVAQKADWAKWMLSRKPQVTQLFNFTKPTDPTTPAAPAGEPPPA